MGLEPCSLVAPNEFLRSPSQSLSETKRNRSPHHPSATAPHSWLLRHLKHQEAQMLGGNAFSNSFLRHCHTWVPRAPPNPVLSREAREAIQKTSQQLFKKKKTLSALDCFTVQGLGWEAHEVRQSQLRLGVWSVAPPTPASTSR